MKRLLRILPLFKFSQSRIAELNRQAQERTENVDWQTRKGWGTTAITLLAA